MPNKILIKLACPGCKLPVKAALNKKEIRGFVLFICPQCSKNVVFYNNKADIISDNLLKKLIKKGYIRSCGALRLALEKNEVTKSITTEFIDDLKKLLDTSPDINDFLTKI